MGGSRKLNPKIQQEIRAYRAFLTRLAEQPPPGAAEPLDVAAVGDRYLYVLESLRAMTIDVAADGRIAYASPSVTTVLGYDPEEMVGTQGIELVHPDDLATLAATARQLRGSRGPFRSTYRARHKQGHWVWLEASVVRNQPPRGPALTVILMPSRAPRWMTRSPGMRTRTAAGPTGRDVSFPPEPTTRAAWRWEI